MMVEAFPHTSFLSSFSVGIYWTFLSPHCCLFWVQFPRILFISSLYADTKIFQGYFRKQPGFPKCCCCRRNCGLNVFLTFPLCVWCVSLLAVLFKVVFPQCDPYKLTVHVICDSRCTRNLCCVLQYAVLAAVSRQPQL